MDSDCPFGERILLINLTSSLTLSTSTLIMGQVVKPPASRVCAGERAAALGRVDAPTRDVVGYNLPSTFEEEMPRTSVHV